MRIFLFLTDNARWRLRQELTARKSIFSLLVNRWRYAAAASEEVGRARWEPEVTQNREYRKKIRERRIEGKRDEWRRDCNEIYVDKIPRIRNFETFASSAPQEGQSREWVVNSESFPLHPEMNSNLHFDFVRHFYFKRSKVSQQALVLLLFVASRIIFILSFF